MGSNYERSQRRSPTQGEASSSGEQLPSYGDGEWGRGGPRGGGEENTYAYSDGDEDDLAVGTVPPYMDHSLADPLVDNDSAQDTAMEHTTRAFEPQRTYSSGQPLRSKASFHRPPAPPASPPAAHLKGADIGQRQRFVRQKPHARL